MTDLFKEIGRTIREAREKKKWSQETLAEKSGQSQPNISSIEAGKDIRLSTLIKTAKALGLDAGKMLTPHQAIHAEKVAQRTEDELAIIRDIIAILALPSMDKTKLGALRNHAIGFSRHGVGGSQVAADRLREQK